jgi:hypothetical protein
LLYGIGSAFVIGFIFLLLLRFLGGPLIWIALLGILAGIGGGGYMLF